MHTHKDSCNAQMRYVENNLICTCTRNGEWMSATCMKHFLYLKSGLHLRKGNFDGLARANFTCTPEKYYLFECNVCLCPVTGNMTADHCTKRHCRKGSKSESCKPGQLLRLPNEICTCSANGYYIDRLCLKIANFRIQRIIDKELAVISGTTSLRNQAMGNEICQKNQIYQADCNFCHCNNAGVFVCTSKLCKVKTPRKSLRRGFDNGKTKNNPGIQIQLPELERLDQKCEPGKRYRYKCNKCQCSANEVPICTTMLCVGDFTLTKRTNSETTTVNK